MPLAQYPTSWLNFVVRTRGEPLRLVEAMRQTVAELDPLQPVSRFESLDHLVARSLVLERFYTTVIGAFAVAAVLLASVGILGVVSFSVHRRVREIGIRVALGAVPGSVVHLLVRQTMLPVISGLLVGLAGAIGANRLFASLLYGIEPTDPPTMLGVAACLLIVAGVSSWLPARRAARVDPLTALRAS